eukprot:6197160-Pleurochrysis_carterae.AAC.4
MPASRRSLHHPKFQSCAGCVGCAGGLPRTHLQWRTIPVSKERARRVETRDGTPSSKNNGAFIRLGSMQIGLRDCVFPECSYLKRPNESFGTIKRACPGEGVERVGDPFRSRRLRRDPRFTWRIIGNEEATRLRKGGSQNEMCTSRERLVTTI